MSNKQDSYNYIKHFFVLPERNSKKESLSKVGIVIYLYYEEDIDLYIKYIKEIPDIVSVLIISTKREIVSFFESQEQYLKNVSCIYKEENRGRDVAALLITARDFFFENDYIAFLHDKKQKISYTREDTYFWTKSMWDNTVISEDYIFNVINLFDENEKLGLALPVLDVSKTFLIAYQSAHEGWGKNYDNAQKICEQLNVEFTVSNDISPISYGTIFWCRTKALVKLYSKEWNVNDFQEEPLPDDGTISHAIERILPYISQDAGFSTCMIMNDTFASSYLEKIDIMLKNLWNKMSEEKGIIYPYQLLYEESYKKKLKTFCDRYENIYIYGAGKVGVSCYKYMTGILEKFPVAFVDSNKVGKMLYNIPVISVEEIKQCYEVGVIISVGPRLIDEIISILKDKCIENYILFFPYEKNDY